MQRETARQPLVGADLHVVAATGIGDRDQFVPGSVGFGLPSAMVLVLQDGEINVHVYVQVDIEIRDPDLKPAAIRDP